jgi:hypothetical protein
MAVEGDDACRDARCQESLMPIASIITVGEYEMRTMPLRIRTR